MARPAVKKRPVPDTTMVGYNPSALAGRFQGAAKSGGGIQPGAHPEFGGATPLDNMVSFFKGLGKGKRKGK